MVSAQIGLASRSRYQARVPLSPPASTVRAAVAALNDIWQRLPHRSLLAAASQKESKAARTSGLSEPSLPQAGPSRPCATAGSGSRRGASCARLGMRPRIGASAAAPRSEGTSALQSLTSEQAPTRWRRRASASQRPRRLLSIARPRPRLRPRPRPLPLRSRPLSSPRYSSSMNLPP